MKIKPSLKTSVKPVKIFLKFPWKISFNLLYYYPCFVVCQNRGSKVCFKQLILPVYLPHYLPCLFNLSVCPLLTFPRLFLVIGCWFLWIPFTNPDKYSFFSVELPEISLKNQFKSAILLPLFCELSKHG